MRIRLALERLPKNETKAVYAAAEPQCRDASNQARAGREQSRDI